MIRRPRGDLLQQAVAAAHLTPRVVLSDARGLRALLLRHLVQMAARGGRLGLRLNGRLRRPASLVLALGLYALAV